MQRTRRVFAQAGCAIVLGLSLLGLAGAASADGAPPVVQFFSAWAEMRPGFSEPHLFIDLRVDDPGGEVPATISSVSVTGPNGSRYDLAFFSPNLGFRGEYFLDAGSAVQPGTYRATVTDVQGNIATASDSIGTYGVLMPATITSPHAQEIVGTTAPTLRWEAVDGAAGLRVVICNADIFTTSGDCFYSMAVPSSSTQFTVPGGVLDPGRRYALWVEAYDTATASLPASNVRARSVQPFSVAGPNLGVFLNQPTFSAGQTLHLGLSLRNDGTSADADVTVWAGLPDGTVVDISGGEMTIPAIGPDVSQNLNDYLVYTFTGAEPAGPYVLGVRLTNKETGQIVGQSLAGFMVR